MTEPERLNEFVAVLDALYAKQEVLAARLDYLILLRQESVEAQEEIENIEREYSQIEGGLLIWKRA